MKALIYTGAEKLAYQDTDLPVPDNGEDLIKVDSAGICGSDMHAYLGHDNRRPAPLILGHEVSGTIVKGQNEGQRVVVNPLVTCGVCKACQTGQNNLCPTREIISMPPREGSFAQYLKMPTANLTVVPQDFSLEKAALAEPIACGWHAVRLAQEKLGSRFGGSKALVLGGGAIGIGAAISMVGQGLKNVTVLEPNDLRRTYLSNKTNLPIVKEKDITDEADFDLIIDGVGISQTRAMASAIVRPGGVIMHIGLGSGEGGLDIRRMTLQEITFTGTYTYTSDDFKNTAAAMFSGLLGELDWYETQPLSEGSSAFENLRQGQVQSPKIILKPWD